MDAFDEYQFDDEYRNQFDDEEYGNQFDDDEDYGNQSDYNEENEWRGEIRSDEQELQPGFSDLERTSRADDCGGVPMVISGSLKDLDKTINILTQDPEERFKRAVGAISHVITEEKLYYISVNERNEMCQIASRLDNVKYLNPTAYILGFLTTNGGKEIDDEKMKNVFNFLDLLNDDSVKPPDVVRYSRFWLELN